MLQMKEIKKQHPGYQIVSLHLRRGDNTDNTNPKQVALNKEWYGFGEQLSENSFYYKYYKKATQTFKDEKVKYLIFTGGKRNKENHDDIQWCKNNFLGDQFLFSEGRNTMEDFSLIMCCDHNIISHVSSFGWWAAYLNINNGTTHKTVAPLHYHPDRPMMTHREGFYPEEWILI